MPKALNIGCGPVILKSDSFAEWENSDFAPVEDAQGNKMPAAGWAIDKRRDFTKPLDDIVDNSIDYILAWHIIEHVGLHEKDAIIKEWHRVLKPGGRLFIACPDILQIAKNIVANEHNPNSPWHDPFIRAVNIYGPYNGFVGDYHKWGYDAGELSRVLGVLGFSQVHQLNPGILGDKIGMDNAGKVGFADYNIQLEAVK
jgi:SAM-dependent methyltransferase